MFYVRIKFSHSFQFQTNSSKSYSEVAQGIVAEIKDRTRGLMFFFDLVSLFTSFFFVFLLVKVIHYRFKFLTSERFDNKYITRDFREIDLQRAKFGRETILPLNHRERTLYITISSCRLVKSEKRKLTQSAMVLAVATLKLGTHMLVDYCLFWVLDLIRYHARFQSKVQAPNIPTVKIAGEGLLADLLRSIVKAFKPLGIELEIDTIPCLPNPLPPDYDRYLQIGTLLILCWFLTLLEPYGLRLRHWIMCYYQPLRARQRSVWLYNHIMRSRLSFLKFARRQLRRNVLGQKGLTKITFKEFLRAKLKCWLCRICLGEDQQEACLLCGEVFRENDLVKPLKCATPGCPGIYCLQCFNDLKNLCTVCLSPIEYGDLSDISEEMGSDEAEVLQFPKSSAAIPKSTRTSKKGDDEEKLLKFSDSGHESDSSEHSYQYEPPTGLSELARSVEHSRTSFRDIEKQEVRDYASMDSFRTNANMSESDDRSTNPDDFRMIKTKKKKLTKRREKYDATETDVENESGTDSYDVGGISTPLIKASDNSVTKRIKSWKGDAIDDKRLLLGKISVSSVQKVDEENKAMSDKSTLFPERRNFGTLISSSTITLEDEDDKDK